MIIFGWSTKSRHMAMNAVLFHDTFDGKCRLQVSGISTQGTLFLQSYGTLICFTCHIEKNKISDKVWMILNVCIHVRWKNASKSILTLALQHWNDTKLILVTLLLEHQHSRDLNRTNLSCKNTIKPISCAVENDHKQTSGKRFCHRF